MAPLTPFRRVVRSERGAELIEFALVFPLLLMVVLGIVDFGFLFQRLEVVTNAAREGARMAVLPGYTDTDVTARVRDYVQSGGLTITGGSPGNPRINITSPDIVYDAGPPAKTMKGKQVVVIYTHDYLFLGPIARWFGGSFSSVPLTGVSTMRDEAQ
jgi:hypothetical protein